MTLKKCVTKCKSNEVYNSSLGLCICANGYYLINGVCDTCYVNEIYDSYTKRCKCADGFYLISGKCDTCSSGLTYNFTTGSCIKTCSNY